MLKSELIKRLAQKLPHMSESSIARSTNHIVEAMCETLSHNRRIEIRGFGSFSLHYRAPRRAHNPKTGERLMTVAIYRPHFKAGRKLLRLVNEVA